MSRLSLFRSWATGHRRALAVASTAVLAVAALLAVLLTWGDPAPEPRVAPPPTTTTTAPPTTTTLPPPAAAPLTGVAGDFEGRLERPALFVKIDNVERARPPVGLDAADIVFEERVEGDLTRLAAVFHSTDADPLGPVRSARTTDLELLPLFGRPLFASSGGNAGVIPQVHAANTVDIGHNTSGEGFSRDPGRPAPHNLFTSTLALYAKAPESPPPPLPLFGYLDPGEPPPAEAVPVGGVAVRFGGPEVSRFTWDAASGTWLRWQRGTPHTDPAGVQLAPENVVVLEVAYDTSGQLGRSVPHGQLTGEGHAVVLTQGTAVEGRWVRPTLADPLRLESTAGQPIELSAGQTFVELPPPGGWSFV